MQLASPQLHLEQPDDSPLRTLADSRQVSFASIEPAERRMLEQEIAKAHIGLCNYSVTISVQADLETDFLVRPGNIVFHRRIFSVPSVIPLFLRHAIELTIWLGPGHFDANRRAAIAILSALATTRFYLQISPGEREQVAATIPVWLRDSSSTAEMLSEDAVLDTLVKHLESLLPLQGGAGAETFSIEETQAIARAYSIVARPTEYILTQQGDERLLIDPTTGLNRYGCSPRPRPDAITFSSCTASSVSEYAYRDAEMLRHRLMATLSTGDLSSQYAQEMESIRSGLKQMLDLDVLKTEVILSSSGTDAELYPLVLFRSGEQKLVNIVVAPDEVGSGTVPAAGGRHFGSRTPLGAKARHGDPIEGLPVEHIEVVCIPIRADGGASLTQKELKQRIADAVTDAARIGDRIILHIVDNTKTGIVAPDTDFVVALQKTFGAQLVVVVDACQLRLEKSNLHRYLNYGFCVLITGSKFFTGPPFGGALLIPPPCTPVAGGDPLPKGFSDYFSRSEVPLSLQERARYLSSELNLGLLFRWAGALKEMRSFFSVSPVQRTTILRTFRRELMQSIRENRDLGFIECPIPYRWQNGDETLWDAQPTIFSFAVKNPDDVAKWMAIRELKKVYYLLNQDCAAKISHVASAEECQVAAQKCHIGQPVTIARCKENGETGALRIACGARLVYGITYDSGLGDTPVTRFQRELSDARTVLAKVSLILKYWRQFCEEGQP